MYKLFRVKTEKFFAIKPEPSVLSSLKSKINQMPILFVYVPRWKGYSIIIIISQR